jgi:hypothetical protein
MRRVVVYASVMLIGLVGSIGPMARATDDPAYVGGWVQCKDAGTLHFSPGETLTPRPIHIFFTLDLFDCTSSDPSIHGGSVGVGTGSVEGSLGDRRGRRRRGDQLRWPRNGRA